MADEKILIVDDDEITLEVIAHRLSSFGLDYVKAGDGKAAVRKMREESFHLVLTDIKMPEMDGLELMKHIKERYPDVPVVLMTGFRDEHTCEEALAAGAVAFLEKPVTRVALEECLRKVFDLSSSVA